MVQVEQLAMQLLTEEKMAALLYKLITTTYLISSMKLVLMSLLAAEVELQVEEALVLVPAVVQVVD